MAENLNMVVEKKNPDKEFKRLKGYVKAFGKIAEKKEQKRQEIK